MGGRKGVKKCRDEIPAGNKKESNSNNFFPYRTLHLNFPPGIFSLEAKTFAGALPFIFPANKSSRSLLSDLSFSFFY